MADEYAKFFKDAETDRLHPNDLGHERMAKTLMQQLLAPIRERRQAYSKDMPSVIDMLLKGTEQARFKAAETLSRVRRAMCLDHFAEDGLGLAAKAGK